MLNEKREVGTLQMLINLVVTLYSEPVKLL